MITAICPGSYDPVTNGHVDVITRAAGIFDRVVVGVVGSPHHKQPMFTIDERVAFLRDALAHLPNVEIDVFRELVVDFAHKWEAKAIVKGLRVISDFEWEFQMNQLNRHLAPDVETMYVMASPQVSFVSSSGVKEIACSAATSPRSCRSRSRGASRSSSRTAARARRRIRASNGLSLVGCVREGIVVLTGTYGLAATFPLVDVAVRSDRDGRNLRELGIWRSAD